MRRSVDINWYEGIIFSGLLFVNVPWILNSINTISQGHTSAWIPLYLVGALWIHGCIYLLLGLFCSLGIIFYLMGQKKGWFFLFANSFYFSTYEVIIGLLPNDKTITYYFFLGASIITTILLLYVIKKRKISILNISFSLILSILLLMAEYFKYRIAAYLSLIIH
jgi:hypothetical protein